MCENDKKIVSRMKERRQTIRQDILPNLSALRLPTSGSSVWVDGEQLRRLLSCTEFDDTYRSGVAETCGGLVPCLDVPPLCDHEKLHPSIARRGKLLPKNVYEGLCSLVEADRHYFGFGMDSSSASANSSSVLVVSPAENMYCEECCKSYHRDLSHKLDLLKAAQHLYNLLNSEQTDPSLQYDPEEEDVPQLPLDERYVYMISRKFISNFRGIFADLFKAVLPADSTADTRSDKSKSPELLGISAESIAEGIDAFDISDLYAIFKLEKQYASDSSCSDSSSINGMASSKTDALDTTVNGKLACKYDRFRIPIKLLSLPVLACAPVFLLTVFLLFSFCLPLLRSTWKSSQEAKPSNLPLCPLEDLGGSKGIISRSHYFEKDAYSYN